MIRRIIIPIFIVAQITLLGIELFTKYDDFGRQNALALTNVIAVMVIIGFDRWLKKRGGRVSLVSFIILAGAIWLDALGNFQHLYAGFWWWDRLTHTVGGMALSAGFIDLFLAMRNSGRMQVSWGVAGWMGLLVGQLVGSLYEISEWLGDFWFDTHRVQGPYDTPHDLFQNLLGGLVILFVMWRVRKRK